MRRTREVTVWLTPKECEALRQWILGQEDLEPECRADETLLKKLKRAAVRTSREEARELRAFRKAAAS